MKCSEEECTNVAEFSPEQWTEVSATANWLIETQYIVGVEYNFLSIISQIKNERDYLSACDENVLPLCEVAEEGEPCTQDDELDPFYEVLDNVIDCALLGKAYPLGSS